ncbi:AGAP011020-PA-like protein [Anopheles sinensis]|uniref:AGAP011020-PA-like protein n=1 Tax=Anopheles sinensis TaxID=74873 RepID=A0A084W980_ANOSI|nr:AGAP011020-PA-like protein [Anopheles sinensis]
MVSKLELKHNDNFLNTTVTTMIDGEKTFNKSYVIEMISVRDLKEIRCFVTYSVLALNGNIQNKLFSRSFDLCQFFRRPNMDRLMKLFYDYLTATSTMPSVCPVPRGFRAQLNVVLTKIPGFFPESDFLVDVNLYTGLRQVPMLESRWIGRIQKIN